MTEEYLDPKVYGRTMLIQDRYHGIYSNGLWLGVMDADRKHTVFSRASFVVCVGPSGGDMEAAAFWDNPPDWIVAGQSPKHVIDLIIQRRQGTTRHDRSL